jgi:hypothetical protein
MCVLKHAFKLWEERKCLLLQFDRLPSDITASLNFSANSHLVGKPGTPAGRWCLDLTNADPGVVPMNTPETKALGDSWYGILTHPTLESIAHDLLTYVDNNNIALSDMRGFVFDIHDAFGQIKSKAEHAGWSAVLVADNIICIPTVGRFGASYMPAAFGPFSRGIQYSIRVNIDGTVSVYVDDITCFVKATTADTALNWVRTIYRMCSAPMRCHQNFNR